MLHELELELGCYVKESIYLEFQEKQRHLTILENEVKEMLFSVKSHPASLLSQGDSGETIHAITESLQEKLIALQYTARETGVLQGEAMCVTDFNNVLSIVQRLSQDLQESKTEIENDTSDIGAPQEMNQNLQLTNKTLTSFQNAEPHPESQVTSNNENVRGKNINLKDQEYPYEKCWNDFENEKQINSGDSNQALNMKSQRAFRPQARHGNVAQNEKLKYQEIPVFPKLSGTPDVGEAIYTVGQDNITSRNNQDTSTGLFIRNLSEVVNLTHPGLSNKPKNQLLDQDNNETKIKNLSQKLNSENDTNGCTNSIKRREELNQGMVALSPKCKKGNYGIMDFSQKCKEINDGIMDLSRNRNKGNDGIMDLSRKHNEGNDGIMDLSRNPKEDDDGIIDLSRKGNTEIIFSVRVPKILGRVSKISKRLQKSKASKNICPTLTSFPFYDYERDGHTHEFKIQSKSGLHTPKQKLSLHSASMKSVSDDKVLLGNSVQTKHQKFETSGNKFKKLSREWDEEKTDDFENRQNEVKTNVNEGACDFQKLTKEPASLIERWDCSIGRRRKIMEGRRSSHIYESFPNIELDPEGAKSLPSGGKTGSIKDGTLSGNDLNEQCSIPGSEDILVGTNVNKRMMKMINIKYWRDKLDECLHGNEQLITDANINHIRQLYELNVKNNQVQIINTQESTEPHINEISSGQSCEARQQDEMNLCRLVEETLRRVLNEELNNRLSSKLPRQFDKNYMPLSDTIIEKNDEQEKENITGPGSESSIQSKNSLYESALSVLTDRCGEDKSEQQQTKLDHRRAKNYIYRNKDMGLEKSDGSVKNKTNDESLQTDINTAFSVEYSRNDQNKDRLDKVGRNLTEARECEVNISAGYENKSRDDDVSNELYIKCSLTSTYHSASSFIAERKESLENEKSLQKGNSARKEEKNNISGGPLEYNGHEHKAKTSAREEQENYMTKKSIRTKAGENGDNANSYIEQKNKITKKKTCSKTKEFNVVCTYKTPDSTVKEHLNIDRDWNTEHENEKDESQINIEKVVQRRKHLVLEERLQNLQNTICADNSDIPMNLMPNDSGSISSEPIPSQKAILESGKHVDSKEKEETLHQTIEPQSFEKLGSIYTNLTIEAPSSRKATTEQTFPIKVSKNALTDNNKELHDRNVTEDKENFKKDKGEKKRELPDVIGSSGKQAAKIPLTVCASKSDSSILKRKKRKSKYSTNNNTNKCDKYSRGELMKPTGHCRTCIRQCLWNSVLLMLIMIVLYLLRGCFNSNCNPPPVLEGISKAIDLKYLNFPTV